MSERNVEYRVRAVTRYVVTAHDDTSTQEVGEFRAVELASGAAAALAFSERENGANAVFLPFEGPLPGKVMRCKVVLSSRSQAYAEAPRDKDGKPPGRYTESPWSYKRGGQTISGIGYTADQTDPANIVLDGESLHFSAVCPTTCDPNGADENLIFGQYTPNFNLSAHVRNQGVLASLERGASYYVDFTPVPKP